MNHLEDFIQRFSRLPGLGKKSARRIAYYLLQQDPRVSKELSGLLGELRDRVKKCDSCGHFTSTPRCSICMDSGRDHRLLCVVEQSPDVEQIEASHEYHGLYHVLHGALSPLDGIGPDKLNLSTLTARIKDLGVEEIILATNPTLEGDTTALYIKDLVANLQVKSTRLALGLPIGGDLEYADRVTLARSIRARTRL